MKSTMRISREARELWYDQEAARSGLSVKQIKLRERIDRRHGSERGCPDHLKGALDAARRGVIERGGLVPGSANDPYSPTFIDPINGKAGRQWLPGPPVVARQKTDDDEESQAICEDDKPEDLLEDEEEEQGKENIDDFIDDSPVDTATHPPANLSATTTTTGAPTITTPPELNTDTSTPTPALNTDTTTPTNTRAESDTYLLPVHFQGQKILSIKATAGTTAHAIYRSIPYSKHGVEQKDMMLMYGEHGEKLLLFLQSKTVGNLRMKRNEDLYLVTKEEVCTSHISVRFAK